MVFQLHGRPHTLPAEREWVEVGQGSSARVYRAAPVPAPAPAPGPGGGGGRGRGRGMGAGSFGAAPSEVAVKRARNLQQNGILYRESVVLSRLGDGHPSIVQYLGTEGGSGEEGSAASGASVTTAAGATSGPTPRRLLLLPVALCSLEDDEKRRCKARAGGATPGTAAIMAQLARCIEFLVHKNVVHRDVAPANVLVLSKTSDRVKLTDFGSAYFRGNPLHGQGTGMHSTPGFASFEDVLDASNDALMDLNSLGLLGLYMLRGVTIADVLFGSSEDDRRQNWFSTLTKILPPPDKTALDAMGARKTNLKPAQQGTGVESILDKMTWRSAEEMRQYAAIVSDLLLPNPTLRLKPWATVRRCLKLMADAPARRAALGTALSDAELDRSRAEQGREATEEMQGLLR